MIFIDKVFLVSRKLLKGFIIYLITFYMISIIFTIFAIQISVSWITIPLFIIYPLIKIIIKVYKDPINPYPIWYTISSKLTNISEIIYVFTHNPLKGMNKLEY